MLRTLMQRACWGLINQRISLSNLEISARGLSCGPSRSVTVGIDRQNLSALTLHQTTLLAPQYQVIRNTSSDGSTSGSGSSDSRKNLTAHERIDRMIKDSKKRVFLFMKGVPAQPQCGYSNAVVQILDAYGVEFDSFDVLSDEEVRKEIKTYSNWPTIPQLYVDKTFVGGCDILIQMHQNNELEALFKGKSET